MRTILFGGSFDPPHNLHLHIAEHALKSLNADQVLFIPSGNPPLKQPLRASSAQRVTMLELALKDIDWAKISYYELEEYAKLKTLNYSFNTVSALIKSKQVEANPYLLLGDDWSLRFKDWYKAAELAELVTLVVAKRLASAEAFAYRAIELDNVPFNLSSTFVRQAIAKQRAYQFLLPPAVSNYIKKTALYQT